MRCYTFNCYLLEEIESVEFFVDLPDFIKASNFYAANNHNNNQPCHHDHRLEHISPNNSLQAALKTEKKESSSLSVITDDYH